MIDIKKEKELAIAWLENQEGTMDDETLVYLSINGYEECAGFCASREYSEDHACRCRRQTFPTNKHYELYLDLRQIYQEWTKLAVIASATEGNDSESSETGETQ